MKKFRAYRDEIIEHEIVKETEKQIVYKSKWGGNDIRESKDARWYSWHDTFEDAKQKLVEDAKSKINTCIYSLEYAKKELSKIEAL